MKRIILESSHESVIHILKENADYFIAAVGNGPEWKLGYDDGEEKTVICFPGENGKVEAAKAFVEICQILKEIK